MSEYGLKIKNIQAGSLYEYNLGVRENYEYKNAMFTNSLFYDFIVDNGLKTWKEKGTRDIICLEFDYGSKSYEEDIAHLRKLSAKAKLELKLAKSQKNSKEIQRATNYREKISKLYVHCNINKDKYCKKSKDEIRDLFYTDGVDVEYITYDKKNTVKKCETIHYKMLYRSTGKAKKGSCMFIRDKLYNRAIDFLRMGIKLPRTNAPLVEIGAYSPLVASTIVSKVKINPKNILIIKDIDSYFNTKVISIETNENKECIAKTIDNYRLKNTLFDGQALIDSSIFPDDANGYILLRHHFCKMAAFKTNIQLFFKDYFKESYLTAQVVDMFGNTHYAKDIELITTDNSMKWLKFNVSYDYWCDKVYENNCMFGIVKTAHKSKLGDVQKMSYQMVNALDMRYMPQITQKSVEYIESLKSDDDVFLDYLKHNDNFSNDYTVLCALVQQDRDFLRSEYFRTRKFIIMQSYVKNFKSGKIIQDADNLVIVGSPYAMLLASAGDNVDKDDTFYVEEGTIQCFTQRFKHDEYLAEFRSPFNSKNNMGYLHNVHHPKMFKYFDFGEQIIAVNMIGTDFQDRNNGADQDSDMLYVTNQLEIVLCAKSCYKNYPTIVNNIPKQNKHYDNTPHNFAMIDNNLSKAQMAIGEASNLAQIALTYTYNFKDKKYEDAVCILSVLAQVAIDNAKRQFDIDLNSEIKRIKKNIDIKINKYPKFWQSIGKNINSNNINYSLECPMNYLSGLKIKEFKPKGSTLPMEHFFVKYPLEKLRKQCKKVEDLIQTYSLDLYNENVEVFDDERDYLLLRSDFDNLIKDISLVYLSNNYLGLMSWLVDRAFLTTPQINSNINTIKSKTNYNKSILLKTLYSINKQNLLKIFSKNV